MILPLMYAFFIRKDTQWKWIIITLILTLALYFSYSRAALISVSIGFILYLCLILKIRLRWIISIFVLIFGIGSFFILNYKNNTSAKSSVHKSDFSTMVKSISDPGNYSNTERFNRWTSAYKMFEQKPMLGFGPGTFMFVYGRYQESKTFVSVSDASMGGAHSEYLKPLSEEGILGLLFVLAILLAVLYKAFQLTVQLEGTKRKMVIACMVGLTTYYVHGFFNFFLETDKASVLFWGLIAYIIAVDIRFNTKRKESNSPE
jgi:O-antigen ligase